MGVTKYKKEFILNDTEKIKNWKSLSPEFKRFERNMQIFSIIFLIFVFSFGLIMVIAGNSNGWISVVIGFSFLLSSFIRRRQMKTK
jgi:membrane protein YdbS with pleckstrin-like domain